MSPKTDTMTIVKNRVLSNRPLYKSSLAFKSMLSEVSEMVLLQEVY